MANKFQKLGCCGSLVKIMLSILNSLFLLLGLTIFIVAAVVKWSSAFNKLINIKQIDSVISTSSISAASTVMLFIGGFCIVFAVIGLIGARCLSKPFLIIYEVIILILFIVHIVFILILIFGSSKVEDEFKKEMTNAVNKVNSNSTEANDKCELLKSISDVFKCCGDKGPGDFKNTTACCKDALITKGCTDETIKVIKDNAINLLVIPSVIILVVELLGLIMVPFLIGRIRKEKGGSYSDY
jgi:hypothetical protein